MLEIRRYQPADRDAVWDLHVVALEHAGAYLGSGPWDDDLRNVETAYLQNQGEFLVGICESQLVAMGGFIKLSDGVAEIRRIRVLPTFQRRGFGWQILEALETKARETGYKTLRLDTSPTTQAAAYHLYIKSGYQETGELFDIGDYHAVYMEKSLT